MLVEEPVVDQVGGQPAPGVEPRKYPGQPWDAPAVGLHLGGDNHVARRYEHVPIGAAVEAEDQSFPVVAKVVGERPVPIEADLADEAAALAPVRELAQAALEQEFQPE